MKRQLCSMAGLLSVIFLSLSGVAQTTFTSANAKTTPGISPANMLQVDYKALYNKETAPVTGGIIGEMGNGGGEIRVSVYSYDESVPNGHGELIYGIRSTETSNVYVGYPWSIVDPNDWRYSRMYTDETRIMAQRAKLYIDPAVPAACHSDKPATVSMFYVDRIVIGPTTDLNCREYLRQQPVIVEAVVQNATLKKVRIPFLGEFSYAELFGAANPFCSINSKVTLGAHRGDWQDVTAPENTMNSIQRVIDQGYDMIELDLWLTKDNQVIVFHDMGLNKRTELTGDIKQKTWSEINMLYVKNRFDELIQSSTTRIELLSSVLDYIKLHDTQKRVYVNLDRSANDMDMFKRVYQVVAEHDMLDRAIFKGRYEPDPTKTSGPTVTSIWQAFREMYPQAADNQLNNKIRMMRFTPILFDNNKNSIATNDDLFATKVKQYIDDMTAAGMADGFELNYKSLPVGSPDFANSTNDNVFLLRKWTALSNKNFVEYVHDKHLPVGIFASVPEVCAVPDFVNGTRNPNDLRSGFVKEDADNNFAPFIKAQGLYDFRGDWEFYIPAGADYVISDRPDALREYLKAIGRFQ